MQSYENAVVMEVGNGAELVEVNKTWWIDDFAGWLPADWRPPSTVIDIDE